MTAVACAVWHITAFLPVDIHPEALLRPLIKELKSIAKKWSFQLERGEENGTLHWQIVLSLYKKKRRPELIKLLNKLVVLRSAHVSVASNGSGGDDVYAMKLDTRVEGPWSSDTWIDEEEIPAHLVGARLLPWQQAVVDFCEGRGKNMPQILLVMDEVGQRGKTFLCNWLSVHKKAQYMGALTDTEKLMGAVCKAPRAKAYSIDVPRHSMPGGPGMDAKKARAMWTCIESLATGHVYDTRYTWDEKIFDPPRIVIFTNEMNLARGWMSQGRVAPKLIDHHGVLIDWTPHRAAVVLQVMTKIRDEEAKAEGEIAKHEYDEVTVKTALPAAPTVTSPTRRLVPRCDLAESKCTDR